jgi:hypothetical protein
VEAQVLVRIPCLGRVDVDFGGEAGDIRDHGCSPSTARWRRRRT